jgi:hypothetical protein
LTPCPFCRKGKNVQTRVKACQGKLIWDLAPATFKVTQRSDKDPGNELQIWPWQSCIRPRKLVVILNLFFKKLNIGNVEERRRKTPGVTPHSFQLDSGHFLYIYGKWWEGMK